MKLNISIRKLMGRLVAPGMVGLQSWPSQIGSTHSADTNEAILKRTGEMITEIMNKSNGNSPELLN